MIYLPKSKADKKKSLLGNSEGSDAGEILKEVIPLPLNSSVCKFCSLI